MWKIKMNKKTHLLHIKSPNQLDHSSYLTPEPHTLTRLKLNNIQSLFGAISLFIFFNWTTYKACLGLYHVSFSLIEQHTKPVWGCFILEVSCFKTIILVRWGWQIILLDRKDRLTCLDFLSYCQKRLGDMYCFMDRLEQISF